MKYRNNFSLLLFICTILCAFVSFPAACLCLFSSIFCSPFFQKLFKRTLKKWVTHALPAVFFILAAFCIIFQEQQTKESQDVPDIFTENIQSETVISESAENVETQSKQGFYIAYFDVGQGDSALIVCDGHAMLVDAGLNDQGSLLKNYLKQCGIKQLDYLVLTHFDADHIGAADVIIDNYSIDTLIMPDAEKDTETYRDVIAAMKYAALQPTYPAVGDKYTLGSASFRIVAPNSYDYGDNANNYSVGFIITYGNTRFFFAGDAEKEAEDDMMANGLPLNADVYKVSHHGSSTCSGSSFLDAINPSYAVISCGKNNSYGHPHEEVIKELESRDITIFRTDKQGTVYASSDGENITFSTDSIAGADYTGTYSLNPEAIKNYTFPSLPTKKVKDYMETMASEDTYNKISDIISGCMNSLLE
ncbi:MAG: MBL fold metallo-hydrolase [Lachnospiraceae bacterium]|nr:MBL fold metallo-hydrolase [Lachnospiraceae bacterium]